MPTDPKEVKILKYTLYALIFILTSITSWNAIAITQLPDNYVRLERYKEDRLVYRDSLKRIELKIDSLINMKLSNEIIK